MDFNSLSENSPVYIVRKRPFEFVTGTLKSKGSKQLNNPYMLNSRQMIDIVLNVGGNDEIVPNVPSNLDVVQYGNSYYSTTPDGATQAIAGMVQNAQSVLDDKEYYDSVVKGGKKAMADLNPQYAESLRQAEINKELQVRIDGQDKKIDEVLSIVRDLSASLKG